jgi:hypothetical protein
MQGSLPYEESMGSRQTCARRVREVPVFVSMGGNAAGAGSVVQLGNVSMGGEAVNARSVGVMAFVSMGGNKSNAGSATTKHADSVVAVSSVAPPSAEADPSLRHCGCASITPGLRRLTLLVWKRA